MGKDVVVIASGETERRSLPHLAAHLQRDGISLRDVRIPPGGKALNVEMAEKLVKAAWYERIDAPPDKFVILVDADGKDPDDVLRPFRQQLEERISRRSRQRFSLPMRSSILRHGTLPTFKRCEITLAVTKAVSTHQSRTKFRIRSFI